MARPVTRGASAMVLKRLLGPCLLNILLAALAWYSLGRASAWDGTKVQLTGSLAFLALAQFVALAALIDRCVRIAVRWRSHQRDEQHLPRLGVHIISFLIYAVSLSAGVRLVFHQSLEPILAASGIIGLVFAFAVRGLVSDIFAGIALHLDTNVRRGDWLHFQHRGQEITARLIEFDWRTAILHDLAENAVLIPNSEFAQLRVNNRSFPTPFTEACAKIEVGAEHDHQRVIAILQNAANRAAADGHIMSQPEPYIRMANIANGVMPFEIWYCIGPQVPRGRPRHFVLAHAMAFLKASGIPVVPVAHQNAHPQSTTFSENFGLAEVRQRILGQVPFFSMLSQEALLGIAQKTLPMRISARQVIIQAGDSGDSMFVVLEGQLDVILTAQSSAFTVASLWPGDCFGEMSLFTGAARSATVVARQGAILMEIKKQTMFELFQENPPLMDWAAAMIEARNLANSKKIGGRDDAGQVEEAHQVSFVSRIAAWFMSA